MPNAQARVGGRTSKDRNGKARMPNSSPAHTTPASRSYVVICSMVANNNLVLEK